MNETALPASLAAALTRALADPRRRQVLRALRTPAPAGDRAVERLTGLIRRLLDASASFVTWIDEGCVYVGSAAWRPEAAHDRASEAASGLAIQQVFCPHVLATAAPLLVSDVRSDPRFRDHADVPVPDVIACLSVPLVVDGEIIGSLCVVDDRPRDWSDADEALLAEVAETVRGQIEARLPVDDTDMTECAGQDACAAVAQLRFALDAARVGVWTADLDSGRMHCSAQWRANCGVAGEEDIGSYAVLQRRIHPDDRAAQAEAFAQSLKRGAEYAAEYRVIGTDGGIRWIYDSGRAAGRMMTGITLDITERKRAEADLRRANILLDTLLSHAPIGFACFDRNLRFITINERLAEINGFPAAEHVGRHVSEIVPGLAPMVEKATARIIETGRAVLDQEVVGETPGTSGQTRYWKDSWYPVHDARGELAGFGVVVEDVTAQRLAQAALAQSEARYRILTEVSPQMVWTTDASGNITYANQYWFDYSGQTREQSMGVGWAAALHPDDRARLWEAFARSADSGVPYEVDIRLRRADGQYRWHLSRALPQRYEGGRIMQWLGVTVDVHERRQAEDALRETADALRATDRRKDQFLAILGHELRDPLAPLRNASEVLRRLQLPDGPARQAAEVIVRQVAYITRLVDDLLDVSRVRQGKIRLHRGVVQLNEVIVSAIELAQAAIDAKQQHLTVELPDQRLYVDGDAVRLQQVLANLLNNASKYTAAGGNITLGLGGASGVATIEVEDDGIGIDKDLLPSVFDLFIQADRSLVQAQGGLGIGLALVRSLVEMHGGSVQADSGGVGKGSRFTIHLPLMNVREPD